MESNKKDLMERGVSFEYIKENCKTIGDVNKLTKRLEYPNSK